MTLISPWSNPVRAQAAPPKSPDLFALARVKVDQEAQRLDQALAALDAIEPHDLADHIALIRARLLHERGRLPEASAAARAGLALDPPTELKAALHHELARIAIESENLIEAYQDQRSAWETTRRSEYAARLAMDLALAFEKRNRPGVALQLYRRIWTRWTLSDVSPEAFARGAALTLGTGAEPPSPRPLLKRAHRLREGFRCDAALESYEDVLSRTGVDPEERHSAELGRADCLFQRRRYTESAAAYQELYAKNPKDWDSAIRVARAYARSGQSTKALAEFAKIIEIGPPSVRARSRYLSAVVQRTSNPKAYVELMHGIENQKAAPGLARLARWSLTWDLVKKKRFKQALPRLAKEAQGSIWDIEVQRGMYWYAVALVESGKVEQGKLQLRDLARKLPLSYYGLMAASRIGEQPTIEYSFVGQRKGAGEPRSATRARWLLEAGYDDLAELELTSWRYSRKLTRDERMSAARILHELGNHNDAVRTIIDGFGGTLEQGIDPDWRDAWQLAWPQPFDAWVSSAIQEFGFDRSLVYAIMREESRYRPEVSSAADARGLMQIIPPTGKRIASDLGVKEFGPERLFEPATNIRFGTYYLKLLVGQFDGSHSRAIASYNAGPEIVTEWMSRDGRLPDDFFVESVPYGETRRYLRRVLQSYKVYELLYDKTGQLRAQAPAQRAGLSSR